MIVVRFDTEAGLANSPFGEYISKKSRTIGFYAAGKKSYQGWGFDFA